MSQSVLPTLAGLTWNISARPEFSTRVRRSLSGYEARTALRIYPLWTFNLKYDLLRDNTTNNELKTLLGFFNLRQGAFDSFLFAPPADSAVTSMGFGTGTGAQTVYQMTRSYGGYIEPVNNLNAAPLIYVAGVLKTVTTDYTIDSTGQITFVAAPANGAALTWTGTFYYRCRFLNDSIDPMQFMQNLYDLGKLDFVGSPINKV
jgi:uncharacterized protein (TIGR02217 family)